MEGGGRRGYQLGMDWDERGEPGLFMICRVVRVVGIC